MATFSATITYPDAKQVDLRDTLCLAMEYNTTIPNPNFNNQLPEDPVTNPPTITNPETKAQFIQRMANDHLRRWVSNTYKTEKDRQAQATVQDLGATS